MIQFKDVPYLRPDMDAMEKEMRAGIAALEAAGTFPEAYYALLSLEAPFGVLSSILVGEETLNAAMAVGFVLIFLAVLCSETKFAFLRRGKKGVDSPAPDGYNSSQANTLQTCDGEK